MKMTKFFRSFTLSVVIMLVLTSCSILNPTAPTPTLGTPSLAGPAKLELAIQADTSVPFTTAGQVIKYSYSVRNAGTAGVPAGAPNIMVITGAAGAVCPDANTVGNKDATLDVNEVLVCTSSYTITQDDVNRGSIPINVTASVSGISSAPVAAVINISKPTALRITKAANPTSYDRAGQTIVYTYVITNIGTANLGPAQFTVSDTGFSAPINCGDAAVTLAPNATVFCSATYTVTQADMGATTISTNAVASGGGTGTSLPATAAVTKGGPSSSSNLTPGSTITHQVSEGEWLWQIARCYGADPIKVLQANPQLPNPRWIKAGTNITVPNIGSIGKIYKVPNVSCVGTHVVQTGDTWSSIASKYNADVTALQMANSYILTVGKVLVVPLNSANGAQVINTGNCMDLTRNLTFAGVPAKSTHFNVCGQMDAYGNMNIRTIKVYQRPEDVGLGSFVQDITLPAVTTATPLNNAGSLVVGDVNYDGNDDFRIIEFLPAGPNVPYLYYIYDPGSRNFVFNETYRKIISPEFPGNSEIRSKWRESAGKWGIDTYKVTNNVPVLTQRETWEVVNGTQARHVITVFNADGSNRVTVDEVVPIPAQ
jgi:LysM repeat protein